MRWFTEGSAEEYMENHDIDFVIFLRNDKMKVMLSRIAVLATMMNHDRLQLEDIRRVVSNMYYKRRNILGYSRL
ncbi:MAG: hypothetical protein ACI4XL_09920 [Bacillus sp. (in: firmicutes)]